GARRRISSGRRAAASPMRKIWWSTAAAVRSSALNAARSISPANLVARSAAARMSSTRRRQSRDMPRLAEHSLSETRMQAGRHDQVDATTEDLFEPLAKPDVPEEPRHFVGLELDQHIHVALRAKGGTKHRPEQGQLADAMTAAERREARTVDGDGRRHARHFMLKLYRRHFL